jgi:ribosomal protein S18 acetylase RimI-like enzyme
MSGMVRIRPAEQADGPSIAEIIAATWRAAYVGLIPAQTLAERTDPAAVARDAEWRSTHSMDGVLVAEAPARPSSPRAAGVAALHDGTPDAVGGLVGFAAFGPERDEGYHLGQPQDEPPEHGRAELYAVYVLPGHWSGGVGRALMNAVLALTAEAGYTDVSLWVLEANSRARRFYEKAGFRLTGESGVLGGLRGLTQVRYRRLVG